MRRILVENARRRRRLRHGGGRKRIDLDRLEPSEDGTPLDVLALDEALEKLAAEEKTAADVVKLRYFAGLTIEQAAAALDIAVRTANRHWAYAKAWLYQQLSQPGDAG
jgi:RNA polymerase sigma factor (TIGR02999 family)